MAATPPSVETPRRAATAETAANWVRQGMLRGRLFMPLPDQLLQLSQHRAATLDRLDARLMAEPDDVVPSPATLFTVPKKRVGTRRAPLLALEDHLMMSALVIACYDAIQGTVSWVQHGSHPVNYHEPLPEDVDDLRWIENFLAPYARYRARIDSALQDGRHVLRLDVRDFASSVRPDRLAGLLRVAQADEKPVQMLQRHMETWSAQNGLHGVPMGHVFTDPLLKLYLDPVDRELFDAYGTDYFRYVDDICVVIDDPAQKDAVVERARAAIGRLGLSLNDDKTKLEGRPETMAHPMPGTHEELVAAYEGPIREALLTGETETEAFRRLFKHVVYGLGTHKDGRLVPEFGWVLDAYRPGGKYLMNYLQRAGATTLVPSVIHNVLTTTGDGSPGHYALYRRAAEYATQNSALPHFQSGGYMPDYQRVFIESCRGAAAPKPRAPMP